MGSYDPRDPQSFSELPPDIQEKVSDHLESRLGEFTKKLTFTGGQVVDFDKLAQIEPGSKNYRWEVHAYDLHFEFQMPEVGIQSYTAQIKLRSDGSVLKEIDLPHFVKSPEKLHFLSLQEASYVAVDHGFRGDKLEPSLSYNEKEDALIWDFEEVTKRGVFGGGGKGVSISVHTGKVIDEWEFSFIY